MGVTAPTIDVLREAVEKRDAERLKALYAADAVITVVDSLHPPSQPRTISGAEEIGAYLDDVYGREMTHTIEGGVVDAGRMAYLQSCRYGDGPRVIASSLAELGPGGIVRQTIVQAWDA